MNKTRRRIKSIKRNKKINKRNNKTQRRKCDNIVLKKSLTVSNINLIKALTRLHTPTSQEHRAQQFIMSFIKKNKHCWDHKPTIFTKGQFKNNIVVVFGKPKVAMFTHIDSVGFTVGHNHELFDMGGIEYLNGAKLRGYDMNGKYVTTKLKRKGDRVKCLKKDNIPFGTNLTYLPKWKEDKHKIHSGNLDNKVGVFIGLCLAKHLKHGVIVFSCGEEVESGNVNFLTKFIHDKYNIRKTLILDTTLGEMNIKLGKGVVISMRDEDLPNPEYIKKIIDLAKKFKIPHQLEVSKSGSSDGKQILNSPYMIDWAFVGPAIKHIHTNNEICHKIDIVHTYNLYRKLIENLG